MARRGQAWQARRGKAWRVELRRGMAPQGKRTEFHLGFRPFCFMMLNMRVLLLSCVLLFGPVVIYSQVGMSSGRKPDKNKIAENAVLTDRKLCGEASTSSTRTITGSITRNEFAADGVTLTGVTIKNKRNDAFLITIDSKYLKSMYSIYDVAAIQDALIPGRYIDLKTTVCGQLRVAERVDLKRTTRSVF